ncbi:restriction endonuclease subunit S [Methylophilus sp. Leaf414]|uniref:restriction endonuclease subunit S n=1 Tax=Methylophilus sp. Leaf414 TaxID=1736371 RepID=UPI000701F486|nr:restriction endonuclease subunit S [Methylophilus sp. Leaf414]KQT36554.1 hypothetical protein ASG24_05165 [Methylophilus sp. Leaf414]
MNWAEFFLDDIANVFNGKTPSKLEQRDEGYPVLKIKDVTESGKFKGMFESFVDVELANKSKLKLIQLNDTLILNAAHNAAYVGSKQYRAEQKVVGSLPTGEWLIIRGKNNKVDSAYLNFWFRLESTKFNIRNMVKGIHLYPKDVARLKINLPPLAEQQKIAAILDAADSLRQKDQQLVEHYTALSQSLFLEMFGDPFLNPKNFEKTTLSNLIEFVQIGPFGSQLHKSDYVENGFPLINPVHIVDCKIVPNFSFTLTNEKFKSLPNYHLKTNDLIMARRGEMGRCALVTKNENGYFCGTGSLFIRPSSLVNPMFLLHVLSSKSGREYLEQHSLGVTMMNLNKKIILSIEFGNPPISLQNKFSESLQLIEAQKQQAQASLEKSDALFNSLLQRAFTGELTAKMAA